MRRLRELDPRLARLPGLQPRPWHISSKYYKLIILSNVDNASFAFSRVRLGVAFDAVYTAEDIGSYKPSARNFEYMLDHISDLGLGHADVLHTAESLFHDHVPAKTQHLATCWIYRRHAQKGFGATMDPGTRPDTDFRFNSLANWSRRTGREARGRGPGEPGGVSSGAPPSLS